MDVQTEELDLTALLQGGRVAAKKSAPALGAPGAGPGSGPGPSGGASRGPAQRNVPARPAPIVVAMDEELIDDTSSWSESDEAGGAPGDEGAGAPQEESDDGSGSDDDADAQSKTLHDALGIYGELTQSMKYDARLDPASVKFEPAALLSGVHYATSYDKLRAALDTLRAQHAANAAASQARGVIDNDNFQRFVATSQCVATLLHGPGAASARAQLAPGAGPGAAAALARLRAALAAVMARRAALQQSLRMARFARRYQSVLALPQAVRRVAQSDDAGAVVREWRRAQRVLRGAQGPVFRKVLVELDGVAQQWQETLIARLGYPIVASGDDSGSVASGGAVSAGGAGPGDERWAQRVEGACRALKEMGFAADPWAHFAHAQCRATRFTSLAAVARLVPAMRVAHSPLGGGTEAWAANMAAAAEQLRSALEPTRATLRELAALRDTVARACGAASGPAAALSQLLEHMRRGWAHSVVSAATRHCMRADARDQWLSVCADAAAQLRDIVGLPLASAVEAELRRVALDTLVRVWIDDTARRTPAGLLAAMRTAAALGRPANEGRAAAEGEADAASDELAREAAARALAAFGAIHTRHVRQTISDGVVHVIRANKVDESGVAMVPEWTRQTLVVPGAQERHAQRDGSVALLKAARSDVPVRLCDWTLQLLTYLVTVRHAVDEQNSSASGDGGGAAAEPVLGALAEAAMAALEDTINAEMERITPGLAMRLFYDAVFLREALRPYMSRRAEERFRAIYRRLPTTRFTVEEDTQRYAALLACFR